MTSSPSPSLISTSTQVGNKGKPPKKQRKRRQRRRTINLRKAMFVLPNSFTLSSIFCGFYAILLSTDNPTPDHLYRAGLAIFYGAFFDMADGRVARLTKTQSLFGVQLDSLADLVTFGVAPAVVIYRWGLAEMGSAGAFIAFVYLGSGAVRLARFNVMATDDNDSNPSPFFLGLPIPLAATLLVSLVMLHQHILAVPIQNSSPIAILVLVLSYLMVSNIRYRSFKKSTGSKYTFFILLLLVCLFVAIAWATHPTLALVIAVSGYVSMGLVEEVIFYRRRQAQQARKKPPSAPLKTVNE